MRNVTTESSLRYTILVPFAILAVCSLALAAYVYSSAAQAVWLADAAEKMLAEDRDLAARYAAVSRRRLVVSKDLTEAHSGEFIPRALRAAGIRPGNVTYGDPVEGTGRFSTVQISIEISSATFSGLVSFLRQVETERQQLNLISADIDRLGEDAWKGTLVYGALIPAKPRN